MLDALIVVNNGKQGIKIMLINYDRCIRKRMFDFLSFQFYNNTSQYFQFKNFIIDNSKYKR